MTSAPAPEDNAYLAEDPMAELSDNIGADSLIDDQDESFSVDDLDTQDFSMDLSSDSDVSLDLSIDISENITAETDDEPIDLSDAVIDEPDFSMDIQDNPLEEPSLEDISINLDLSELGSEELDSEESISEELGSGEMDSVDLDDEEFEIPKIDAEDPEFDENLEFSFAGDDFTEVEETENQGFAELESGGFLTDEEESTVSIEDLDVLDIEETSGELEELPLEDFSSEEVPALEAATPEAGDITIDDDIFELEADELEELSEDDFQAPELPARESTSKPASHPVMAEPEDIPSHLKKEIKAVLSYMDNLLEALPENKIEEFAKSEYYETYKKLFKDLGLV